MAIMEIVHFCCCAYDSLFNNLDLSESIPLLFYIIYYLILHEYFFLYCQSLSLWSQFYNLCAKLNIEPGLLIFSKPFSENSGIP